MNQDQLTEKIRRHFAITAVGPSASRNMIRRGDIQHIREFLVRLDLRRFNDRTSFHRALDRATRSLAKLLPKGGWGAARKFLNIYLRNVTYNHYSGGHYRGVPRD
jgi:hypothetical protein